MDGGERKHGGAKKRRHSTRFYVGSGKKDEEESGGGSRGQSVRGFYRGPFDEILSVPLFVERPGSNTRTPGTVPEPRTFTVYLKKRKNRGFHWKAEETRLSFRRCIQERESLTNRCKIILLSDCFICLL